MQASLRLQEGKVLKTLDSRGSPPCPSCQGKLVQRRTTPSVVFEDELTHQLFQTVYRYYTCSCGYRNKTVEWRPIGESGCCEKVISLSSSPNSSKVILTPDGLTLWERARSALCLCGRSYAWRERMVLTHGKTS